MDIDQKTSQAPQRGQRNRLLVGVSVAPAGARQAPAENDLFVVKLASEDFFDLSAEAQSTIFFRHAQLEPPGDAQLLGSGTEQFAGAPVAEQQAQGIEQQRLACAGLPRPGTK